MKYKNDQISSCPCLRGLLWLAGSCIFVCALLFIALNYDNDVRWIEWIQLLLGILGAIVNLFVIWWLSSYRAEKEKETQRQIDALNLLITDLIILSRNLKYYLDIFNKELKDIESLLKKLKAPICSKEEKRILYSFINKTEKVPLDVSFEITNLTFIIKLDFVLYFTLSEIKKMLIDTNNIMILSERNTRYNNKILANLSIYKTNDDINYIEKGIIQKKSMFSHIEIILEKSRFALDRLSILCSKKYGGKIDAYSKFNIEKYLNTLEQ